MVRFSNRALKYYYWVQYREYWVKVKKNNVAMCVLSRLCKWVKTTCKLLIAASFFLPFSPFSFRRVSIRQARGQRRNTVLASKEGSLTLGLPAGTTINTWCLGKWSSPLCFHEIGYLDLTLTRTAASLVTMTSLMGT